MVSRRTLRTVRPARVAYGMMPRSALVRMGLKTSGSPVKGGSGSHGRGGWIWVLVPERDSIGLPTAKQRQGQPEDTGRTTLIGFRRGASEPQTGGHRSTLSSPPSLPQAVNTVLWWSERRERNRKPRCYRMAHPRRFNDQPPR